MFVCVTNEVLGSEVTAAVAWPLHGWDLFERETVWTKPAWHCFQRCDPHHTKVTSQGSTETCKGISLLYNYIHVLEKSLLTKSSRCSSYTVYRNLSDWWRSMLVFVGLRNDFVKYILCGFIWVSYYYYIHIIHRSDLIILSHITQMLCA